MPLGYSSSDDTGGGTVLVDPARPEADMEKSALLTLKGS